MNYLQAILISPHPPALIEEVGYGGLAEASATTRGMLKLSYLIGNYRPQVVVYISPHGNMFSDALCLLNEKSLKGDLRKFGAPDAAFEKAVCQSLVYALGQKWEEGKIPHILMDREKAKKYGIHMGLDHGVLVPMYFLDQSWKNYEIVHIAPGGLSMKKLYDAGRAAAEAIEESGLKTVVVASGDLSHYLMEDGPYGYREEGELLDQEIVSAFREERLTDLMAIDKNLVERGGECGLRGFVFAAGMTDTTNVSVSVYSYEGPFGVGYMTASVTPTGLTANVKYTYQKKVYEDPYIGLAQAAIEKFTREGIYLSWNEYKKKCPVAFIEEVEGQQAGAFVSIHRHGDLRGCIGTISPTRDNLAEEIIYCAVEACSADPRFYPVSKTELESLDIKVDVLKPPEDVDDISLLDEKRYGVIVSKGVRRGLLLPNLEGVDSVNDQIRIAKRKAGIDDADNNVRLKRFEVIRHETNKLE